MDIVARAKNIMLSPNSEWKAIAGEGGDSVSLYTGYIMPLAAIPPVCALIGFSLFLGRFGLGFGLVGAIVQYVLGLAGIYVVALIAQWLAPKFGGNGGLVPALKLVAYSHTPTWLGGIFFLLPFLGVVELLLALYGLYLLYAGVTPVMGIASDRAVTFTAALILSVIVVFVLISFVMRVFVGAGMMGMM